MRGKKLGTMKDRIFGRERGLSFYTNTHLISNIYILNQISNTNLDLLISSVIYRSKRDYNKQCCCFFLQTNNKISIPITFIKRWFVFFIYLKFFKHKRFTSSFFLFILLFTCPTLDKSKSSTGSLYCCFTHIHAQTLLFA